MAFRIEARLKYSCLRVIASKEFGYYRIRQTCLAMRALLKPIKSQKPNSLENLLTPNLAQVFYYYLLTSLFIIPPELRHYGGDSATELVWEKENTHEISR